MNCKVCQTYIVETVVMVVDDGILCPGQEAASFCDCKNDCSGHANWCKCGLAVACCADANPQGKPSQSPTNHTTSTPTLVPSFFPTESPTVSPTNLPAIPPTYTTTLQSSDDGMVVNDGILC